MYPHWEECRVGWGVGEQVISEMLESQGYCILTKRHMGWGINDQVTSEPLGTEDASRSYSNSR